MLANNPSGRSPSCFMVFLFHRAFSAFVIHCIWQPWGCGLSFIRVKLSCLATFTVLLHSWGEMKQKLILQICSKLCVLLHYRIAHSSIHLPIQDVSIEPHQVTIFIRQRFYWFLQFIPIIHKTVAHHLQSMLFVLAAMFLKRRWSIFPIHSSSYQHINFLVRSIEICKYFTWCKYMFSGIWLHCTDHISVVL